MDMILRSPSIVEDSIYDHIENDIKYIGSNIFVVEYFGSISGASKICIKEPK